MKTTPVVASPRPLGHCGSCSEAGASALGIGEMKPMPMLMAAPGRLLSFASVCNSIFANDSVQARRRALGCGGSACARPRFARVPCDARSCGPLHNFRRSLRSLWSNRCNESEHEAREYTRGHKPCASRRRNSPRQPSARRLAGSIALGALACANSPRLEGPRGDVCRGELRTRRLNPGRYLPSGQAPQRTVVFGFGPGADVGFMRRGWRNGPLR